MMVRVGTISGSDGALRRGNGFHDAGIGQGRGSHDGQDERIFLELMHTALGFLHCILLVAMVMCVGG